jgi:hypothetical protein
MRRLAGAPLFFVAAALTAVDLFAQKPPSLKEVLARMAAYLTAYADQYAYTVAEEHYTQRTFGVTQRTRVLDSEFGIVRLSGRTPWLGFRDVTRVNGDAIADREGRLAKLFETGAPASLDQAAKITEESTRFNLGPIVRSVNNPAVVLDLLDVQNQSRFRFSKTGEDAVNGIPVWILRGREVDKPTLIRSTKGENEPAELRAWVDPMTGRLLRAEVTVSALGMDGSFLATIRLEFREDPRLQIWVPSAMSERYSAGGRDMAAGDATYSNYRRFTVDTRILVGGSR